MKINRKTPLVVYGFIMHELGRLPYLSKKPHVEDRDLVATFFAEVVPKKPQLVRDAIIDLIQKGETLHVKDLDWTPLRKALELGDLT